MKLIKKITGLLFVVVIIMCFVISVNAEDSTSLYGTSSSVIVGEEKKTPVSCGLDVIAAKNDMVLAGIKGNELIFSADRFACAMNLSKVDYIVITRLPDAVCGSLYIGSEGVSVNQKLSAAEIGLMTFEESSVGSGNNASFDFTVNGSAYEISCNIFMIDKVNYSPTLSLAAYASLNLETYKGMRVSGVLSAYDPEGDELKYEIVEYPTNGTIVIEDEALGTYTYYPEASFTGEDRFSYVVCDKYGNYSASAEVSVRVSAPSISMVYRDLMHDSLQCYATAVTENGLMNGVQVGNYYYFEADREVTRAEFLVTAMNAVGIKNVPEVSKTAFADDADIGAEMKGYVELAYTMGYISGTKVDGKLYFKPDESIKMSEAAVIISNMIGYAEAKVTTVFADADAIPSWSSKAVESLYTLGIIESADMVSGAGENVTRGDMAKLLARTMLVIGK
ncbi:MAG: S-layer homology domain-containing protein [Clostridia bacterium]|nr:S-layer homology domain-containing protein [Clostridia bacterium]